MSQFSADPARLRFLRAALLCAIVLLSAYIQFSVVARTSVDGPVRSDAVKYVAYAWNLRHHQTFSHAPFWTSPAPTNPAPDKLTLPGYPAFLSLFLNDSVDWKFLDRVAMTQATLGVLTCLLTMLLALRALPFGFAIGAGLVTAISPHLATISTYVLTEALFTCLLTGALYFIARSIAPGSPLRRAALAGAVLGLASLVRPQMQLFPWLVLALCLAIPSWRTHARKAAVGLLCFLAVVGPWQVRNLGVESKQGDPDLLVSTLYHGSFPDLMYEGDPRTAGYAYSYDPEARKHSASLPAVVTYIASVAEQHPMRYARWYLLGKPASFLSWEDPANAGDIFIFPVNASPYLSQPFFSGLRVFAFWMHWPLNLLALGALLVAAFRPLWLAQDETRQITIRLLALATAYVLAMHMVGAPYPRYSIPFRPLLSVLAMGMLAALLSEASSWVRNYRKGDASRHLSREKCPKASL